MWLDVMGIAMVMTVRGTVVSHNNVPWNMQYAKQLKGIVRDMICGQMPSNIEMTTAERG